MSLELSFPGAASADANLLARELRLELAENGLPVKAIAIVRDDPETMNVGGMLELGIQAVIAVHSSIEMAKLLRDFAKRTRSVIKIKDGSGNFDIRTDAIDDQRLSELLSKIVEYYRARSI